MCIIIHKPAGIAFHADDPARLEELLLDARIQNGDGFGIQAWYEGKLVEDYRTVDARHIDDLAKLYFGHAELEVVAHWRWATHGEIEVNNCHPFRIHQGMSFFHNGVLTGFGALKDKSDTLDFVERVLQKLIPEHVLELEDHHQLVLDSFADSGQRFVVTNDLGKVWRFGKWVQKEGIWFSNSGLFEPAKRWVYGWSGDGLDDTEYEQQYANWENWEVEDRRDRDLVWDTEAKQYVKKGLEVIECECFGEVCGERWHDQVGGCSNRAEYEIKMLEDGLDKDGKGTLLYYVRACIVCASQAGYVDRDGVVMQPDVCWELHPVKEVEDEENLGEQVDGAGEVEEVEIEIEPTAAETGGSRALVLVDRSTGTAMVATTAIGTVESVVVTTSQHSEYLATTAD